MEWADFGGISNHLKVFNKLNIDEKIETINLMKNSLCLINNGHLKRKVDNQHVVMQA